MASLNPSLSLPLSAFDHFSGSPNSPASPMSLTVVLFGSLVRLLISLFAEPVASVTTLLYYSDLLPQNVVWERLVRHEMLDRENYLFHFLINFLSCFW